MTLMMTERSDTVENIAGQRTEPWVASLVLACPHGEREMLRNRKEGQARMDLESKSETLVET
jgi:hypothetical protein